MTVLTPAVPVSTFTTRQQEVLIDQIAAITAAVAAGYQPLDSDLTTIAGLTATSDNFMQAKSSAWASRTPAQAAIDLLPFIYPVGCIYFSTNSTDPATSLGFGTWTAFGAGKVPVGFLTSDPDFGTDEATGGAKTHTLTTPQIPVHSHPHSHAPSGGGAFRTNVSGVNAITVAAGTNNGTDAVTDTDATTAGGGGSHNNLQPFIVVRMWKRTA